MCGCRSLYKSLMLALCFLSASTEKRGTMMRVAVSTLPPPPLIPPIGALPALPLIRRAAFVVPTWPGDFSFTKALLDSYATQSPLHADLILVFSFGKDVETFKRSFGDAALKIPGCVPTVYSGERKLMEFDPIFYKKWWTIYSFAKHYDYFLPVDTECRFIRQYSVAKFAMQYFERKRFHCSRSQRITYAISDSMSLFNNSEKIALRPLLRNKTCLVWFNEIPVVETSSALRFIHHVNAFHPTWHKRVFDYLPYANYLALYEGWQFDDLTPFMNGSVPVFSLGEGGGGNDVVMQRVKPHWAYWFAYENEPHKFGLRVFMTFHHDRPGGIYLKTGRRFYFPPSPNVSTFRPPQEQIPSSDGFTDFYVTLSQNPGSRIFLGRRSAISLAAT